MPTFLYPKLFYLFTLVVLLFIFELIFHKKRYATVRISNSLFSKKLAISIRVRLRLLPIVLRFLALSFLIIALARPQSLKSWTESEIEGIDIVLAMDISSSMMTEDFSPNRMEVARKEISKFINSRPNDNIGLVCFSGESFTLSPLTVDHANLLNRLEETVKLNEQVYLAGSTILDGRTAIGQGLVTSINRLRDQKSKSRVVILLTDGVNNTGEVSPIQAAEIAKEFNIRVYTIGVGSDNETIPSYIPSPYGAFQQQVIANQSLDEDVLKKIANITGGAYFRAKNENSLEEIYKDIDQMEKQKIKKINNLSKDELFPFFALLSLILLALEFILRNSYLRTFP